MTEQEWMYSQLHMNRTKDAGKYFKHHSKAATGGVL